MRDVQSAPQVESRWATIGGVKVHYVVGGQGPSKKVLLLHGWGTSVELWRPVMDDLLSRGFQVMALDFPGLGESDLPPEPWGVSDYTNCLRSLLLETDFHPADIIAHSFGGRVAIVLTASWPEMVRRLVLVAGAGIRIESGKVRVSRLIMKTVRAVFSLPGLSSVREPVQTKVRGLLGSKDYLQAGALRETFVKVISQDLREYARRIPVPTLLIWGDKDTETPLEQAKVLEACLPDSGLVVLPGGGHYAYLEQFGRFSIIVAEFLRG